MRSQTAAVVTLLALLASAAADPASSPSLSITGKPTYTTSNEGIRMLFVNPYDCEAPATNESTWVIMLSEPETIYSFQVAVVDANLIDNQELVTVRVGDSDPLTDGASSNSLCAVAHLDATSSMDPVECAAPVSGRYITVTRNDGGDMNVCGLSADLGVVALPPAIATAPLFVPAAELEQPLSPVPTLDMSNMERANAQAAQPPTEVSALPILDEPQTNFKSFASDAPTPAPGPAGETLAPTLAILSLPGEVASVPTPVPAPVPAPELAPTVVLSLATLPADTPTPAPGPVLAPQSAVTVLPALLNAGGAVPVPAPVPAPAPDATVRVLNLATLPGTPVPAPVPAPVPEAAPFRVLVTSPTPAPGPAEELLTTVALTPAPVPASIPRNVLAAEDPTQASGQTGAATTSTATHSSGLSGGAKAGIVIGCLAGVAIAAVAAYVVFKNRSRRPAQSQRASLSDRMNPVYEA